MGTETQVYQQGQLVFILTNEKVIVKTPMQVFFLSPRRHYWNRRLCLIRTIIELGEIQNLDELASWTGRGIEWVSTQNRYDLPEYEVDKIEQLA